jgi:hypothetical protein
VKPEVKPEVVETQPQNAEVKPEVVETPPQNAEVTDPPEDKGDDSTARPKNNKPKITKAQTGEAVTSAKMKIIKGDFAGAVKDLEPFSKSPDPQVHRTLGVAYAKLKNNTRATYHYRKYLELAPNASDADEVRAALEGAKSK